MTEVLARSTRHTPPSQGPTRRDAAASALVLGIAGASWAGWGQEAPPAGWSLPLTIGSCLGLLLALAAGIRTVRYRAGASAMRTARGRRAYFVTLGVEVAVIGVGVAVLSVIGRTDYLAAWILFVVGAHFLPLGRLFLVTGLIVAGVLLVGVAAAAAVVGALGGPAPSAVAGAGGVLVMVVFGVVSLRQSLRATA
jgi:hypothetical protein